MTKYIFDFDDVLFFNTEKFKKHMYKCFEEIGVEHDTVKKYYEIEKEKGWVLHNLVASVLKGENITSISKEELSEKIMRECKNFVNNELIDRIKKLETKDCYMVTHGVKKYQLEKVERTGLGPLFTQIFTVLDSFTRQRSDGSMVRILIPAGNSETEATKLAIDLSSNISNKLSDFVPE